MVSDQRLGVLARCVLARCVLAKRVPIVRPPKQPHRNARGLRLRTIAVIQTAQTLAFDTCFRTAAAAALADDMIDGSCVEQGILSIAPTASHAQRAAVSFQFGVLTAPEAP